MNRREYWIFSYQSKRYKNNLKTSFKIIAGLTTSPSFWFLQIISKFILFSSTVFSRSFQILMYSCSLQCYSLKVSLQAMTSCHVFICYDDNWKEGELQYFGFNKTSGSIKVLDDSWSTTMSQIYVKKFETNEIFYLPKLITNLLVSIFVK